MTANCSSYTKRCIERECRNTTFWKVALLDCEGKSQIVCCSDDVVVVWMEGKCKEFHIIERGKDSGPGDGLEEICKFESALDIEGDYKEVIESLTDDLQNAMAILRDLDLDLVA